MKSMLLRNASSYISAGEATFGVAEIYKEAIELQDIGKPIKKAIGGKNAIRGEESSSMMMPNSSLKLIESPKKHQFQ